MHAGHPLWEDVLPWHHAENTTQKRKCSRDASRFSMVSNCSVVAFVTFMYSILFAIFFSFFSFFFFSTRHLQFLLFLLLLNTKDQARATQDRRRGRPANQPRARGPAGPLAQATAAHPIAFFALDVTVERGLDRLRDMPLPTAERYSLKTTLSAGDADLLELRGRWSHLICLL